jgi:hypothetical protein
MTVRSLNDGAKNYIIHCFNTKLRTIDQLGDDYSRSRRTIVRVLEEAGIDPGIKRRKRLPKPEPLPTVIPTKTPWWKRIIPWVSTITERRFQA